MSLPVAPMTTVGVDLAAEPAKTAMAVVTWDSADVRIAHVGLRVSDADIVAASAAADRIGIDAPFGWPDAFVEFVAGHHHQQPLVATLQTREQRRPLTKRLTDLVVHERSGIAPLSVSADLIAHVALRCAGTLAAMRNTDRVNGKAVEAYPAAALRAWGLRSRGYKGSGTDRLDELVTALQQAAPWLAFGEFDELCRRSDDAFDAVVTALIARAAALALTELPNPEQRSVAEREGWIHVPTGPLDDLV